MFSSRLKVIIRSLYRNKASSFINIFGLTIGLSACLLIFLYLQHEFSFDSFQEKGDRIARVIMEYSFDGSPQSTKGNFTSTAVAPIFCRTFPEVEKGVRMNESEIILRKGDQLIKERAFLYVDSSFFDVFHSELKLGNPHKLLNGPNKVVLTESSARKYFGQEDPLGKLLIPGGEKAPFEITGVIADYPANSQIQFDFLASFSSLGANQEVTFYEANYTTYLLLRRPDGFKSLEEKIAPYMKQVMSGSGSAINFSLEPFTRIHLHSPYPAFVPNISVDYLYLLSGVAFLTLLIACFTYINVSTARSVERAREVGIRKVVGSSRYQIFWQFIGESFLLCTLATILSLQLALMALPWFNELTTAELSSTELFSIPVFLFAFVITAVVSLLAGAYPAGILSGFQPASVLKGLFRNSRSGKSLRQSLVIFQFAISISLIVCTFFIQKQLHFIQNKQLGYDRHQVLVLPLNQKMRGNLSVIKQELKSIPGVLHASRCVSTPVQIGGGYNMRSATMGNHEQMAVTANPVDQEYIQTTGLKIIAGDDFSEQDILDVASEDFAKRIYHFILNERAAAQLGWTPTEAVGKKMFLGDGREGFVRGVIQDFHFESLHSPIKPLVLFPEDWGRRLLVKVAGDDLPGTLLAIQAKWKNLTNDIPFEYRFMDDDYNQLYHVELRLGKVMNLFAVIAILLACMGLFGLSSVMVQQRIKEVGIRKILGATWVNIVLILSGSFTKLILFAIVIASPVAYFAITQWLGGFTYTINLDGWVFGAAGLLAIAIAFLTVSIHGVKAAMTNPAQTLKSE